jgi:hypothetical protein
MDREVTSDDTFVSPGRNIVDSTRGPVRQSLLGTSKVPQLTQFNARAFEEFGINSISSAIHPTRLPLDRYAVRSSRSWTIISRRFQESSIWLNWLAKLVSARLSNLVDVSTIPLTKDLISYCTTPICTREPQSPLMYQ